MGFIVMLGITALLEKTKKPAERGKKTKDGFSRNGHKSNRKIKRRRRSRSDPRLPDYSRESGYPCSGCTPAEPASVSPDKRKYNRSGLNGKRFFSSVFLKKTIAGYG
jgi:hypothetical protein